MKKYLVLLLFIAGVSTSRAQSVITVEPKINVLSAAVTIFNPAVEIGFGKFSAFQVETMHAFAKNNFMGTGSPFQITMAMIEYRAYPFSNRHSGFFAGLNFGLDDFRMSKGILKMFSDRHDDLYDVGQGYAIGLTLGYKLMTKSRLGVEFSVTGGWHHAQHEQYTPDGIRIYKVNATAEWLPYKAGVYLTYRFGKGEK